MKLLVAIPCLNEEATIADLIQKMPKSIDVIDEIIVLVVDDGSTDNTAAEARSRGAVVVSHFSNRGVGTAFKTAVSYAIENKFDFMVNIDGDGQFDPNDIPKLIKPIIDLKTDFVTASRFKDKALRPSMPYVKYLGNIMMSYIISKLCGKKFYDVSCGFRAFSREALLQINLQGAFTYTQETFIDLISKSLRILEVPVRVSYFKGRKSRVAHNLFLYAINASNIILRIYRDYFPFKFFIAISSISSALGIMFGFMFFYHYFVTGKFTGFLFAGFLASFFILSGLGFGFAAIVMDMVVRIRLNQEKMLYIIKSKLL